MKTKILFLFALFSCFGKIHARTGEAIIRDGQQQLCHLFDINDDAIATGHPEQMQFVVQVGEEPVDYVHSVPTAGHTPDADGQGATKDSLNAKLRRTYALYGVEMYVVLISSLDVVINAPLPENITTSQLFTQKLYDDRTNMAVLRAEHKQLTDAIINTSISGRQRDCIVLSQCTYCGTFYKDNGQGCWKFCKVYTWRSQPSTFIDIGALSIDFTNRLKSSNNFLRGAGDYSMLAAAEIFNESAAYARLKENIFHTFTPDSITLILEQFTKQEDYEDLTYAERQHILCVYAGYNMSGSWFFNGIGEEGYVIRVIHFTPSSSVNDLLQILSEPSSLRNDARYHGIKDDDALIVKLIEGTDDALLSSDNNYTLLVKTITQLMCSNEAVFNQHLPADDAGWQNRSIYWYDSHLFSHPPIGTHSYDVTMHGNGSIEVEKEVVDRMDVDYNNAAASAHYTSHWDDSYPPVTFQPFDLVFFTNRSSLSMLEQAGAAHETIHVAPAIFLKYADDKAFNANINASIVIALDIVAIGIGPAAIAGALEAGNWALAAFEAMQFTGAVGNIVANTVNDPDLQALVDKYNLIVGIWGLSRIAASAGKFTVNCLTEAKGGNFHAVSPAVAEDFRQSFQQAEGKLGLLDEPTKVKLQRMEEYLGEARFVSQFGDYATAIDNQVTIIAKNEALPQFIKESFADNNYRTGITNSNVTLYRDFGDMARADGNFATTVSNATREQLALVPDFQNSMRFKATINVPAGQKIDLGKVGAWPPNDPIMPGGADQIVLPENYDHSWITSILDTQTGQVYTFEQFKTQFPELIKRN